MRAVNSAVNSIILGTMQSSSDKTMNIVILGYGAIASYVARKLRPDPRINLRGVLCRAGREQAARRQMGGAMTAASELNQIAGPIDLLIECAGHQALASHGCDALSRGIDLLMVSNGALADDALAVRLEQAASASGATLTMASGAIGAIDAISAARIGGIERLLYRGRKPPRSWRGSAAEQAIDLDQVTEPTVHFSGTARNAALLYPKNANVAATVALAGPGLDHTTVELIADPTISENIHQLDLTGQFGHMQFTIAGNSLPDNPKSSALTAMSVIAAVNRRLNPLVV